MTIHLSIIVQYFTYYLFKYVMSDKTKDHIT